MRNKNLLFLCLLFFSLATSGFAQKTIQLFDGDSIHAVPFEIKSKDFTLRSDECGKLFISSENSKKLLSTFCSIEFSEVLDNVLYRNRLYYSKGKDRKDPNIHFSNLSLQALLAKKNNVFFLRQKEDTVDDED